MLGAACGLHAANAETRIETKIIEYDARGATAEEVNASLYAFGPIDINGYKAWATTAWDPRWVFWYEPRGKKCVVIAVTVTAVITIRMPRLPDATKMQPKLKRAFDAFMKNLMQHERGHERLMRGGVRKIEKGIRSLPPQASCREVDRKANAFGAKVMKEVDQANRAYDVVERRRLTGDLVFPTD
jgi:predicted secreted Zn-dependent protease